MTSDTALPVELTADMTKALPGGQMDDSTYSQIEDALDKIDAPMCDDTGRYLTLVERIAALSATRTAVKPLEWTKHPTAEAWRCDTILGTYQVWVGSIGTGWQFDGLMDRLDTPAAGAEAAKSAAQSDFERRILSALTTEGK